MEDGKPLDLDSLLKAQTEYSVALQRAIEHHCRGVEVPTAIAVRCPYHARMLNERLPKVLGWQDRLQWMRAAIVRHHAARGHERCWENDQELYYAAGLSTDGWPALPCREEFLQRCTDYYQQQTTCLSADRRA